MILGMKLDVFFIRTKEFIIIFNGWLIDFFQDLFMGGENNKSIFNNNNKRIEKSLIKISNKHHLPWINVFFTEKNLNEIFHQKVTKCFISNL